MLSFVITNSNSYFMQVYNSNQYAQHLTDFYSLCSSIAFAQCANIGAPRREAH